MTCYNKTLINIIKRSNYEKSNRYDRKIYESSNRYFATTNSGKKVDAKTLKPKAAKDKGSKSTPEDRDWVKVAGDSSLSNEWFLIDGDAVKARTPKEESSVMHNTKDSAQKGAAEDTASKPFGLTKL